MRKVSAALLISLILAFSPAFRAAAEGGRAASPKNVRVAVLNPENLSGDPRFDDLAEAIAAPLFVGLDGKDWITGIERKQLDRVIEEQKIQQSGAFDTTTAVRLGNLVGANWLLLGSYFPWKGRLRIMLRFVDVETGQVDTGKFLSVEGGVKDPFKPVEELIGKIDRSLARGRSRTPDKTVKPLRIAILPFKNTRRKKEYDPIGRATAELLYDALSADPGISVVERAQIQKLVDEMKLGLSGIVDSKTAAEVGRLHGASALLIGSFMVLGSKVQMTARFVDTESGRVGAIPSAVVSGKLGDLFGLQDRLVDKIRENARKRKK